MRRIKKAIVVVWFMFMTLAGGLSLFEPRSVGMVAWDAMALFVMTLILES